METIQQLIESGRLEQYVLGELPSAARQEVEAWAARYPEVQAELTELEIGLGVFAEAHAIAPPAGLRERVLSRVFAEIGQPEASAAPAATAPVSAVAEPSPLRISASNPQLASPTPAASAARPGFSVWAIAASVLLVLSLVGNALLYSRWQQASSDLVALQDDQARFASNNKALQARYDDNQQQLTLLSSPAQYKLVALAGTKNFPQARARVLYGRADHRVYVDVQQLPPLPAGKQYQLWALLDGKPIDAGMLDGSTAAGDSLQQMKDIARAQTFAMTVENAGGSPSPHLETLTVIGNI